MRRENYFLGPLFVFFLTQFAWATEQPDYGLDAKDLIPTADYEFHLLGLQEGTTTGIFQFKWKGPTKIEFSTMEPQKGSTFSYLRPFFYFFDKAGWEKPNPVWACGFGMQTQLVEPDRDYFILIDLSYQESYMRDARLHGAEKIVAMFGAYLGPHQSGIIVSDEIPLPLYKIANASR